MGRARTLLGLALIVMGTIFLSRALMHPLVPPMPALPPMPAMPNLPPLPPVEHPSFWHAFVGFHPVMLVLLLVVAALWLRRRRSIREQPLA